MMNNNKKNIPEPDIHLGLCNYPKLTNISKIKKYSDDIYDILGSIIGQLEI